MAIRRLALVLGDQLDHRSALFDDFDPAQDRLWMAEVEEEVARPPAHKLRIAFFFSAMRHFRDAQREAGRQVEYHEITDERGHGFAEVVRADVERLQPSELAVVEPGDWRVRQSLLGAAAELGLSLKILPDRHFYCSVEEFGDWAEGRKSLVLEMFYRRMRQHEGVLAEGGEPVGGQWNFDQYNRESFGRKGPGELPRPVKFGADALTSEVLRLVEERFGSHPGRLEKFDLPVTRPDAERMLDDFIAHRLPKFGAYQDAMWREEPLLYHSRLSALLNVKLLDPRDCVDRAFQAWRDGKAPLNSVEGFVRQILGWREFVRGVYWTYMPEYIERNALECEDRDVPPVFWNGETEMECVRRAMRNVLDNAYAHHIQRLMVLGLYAQLLGVHPRRFHDWHMAMYADAIDWVSLPNTLGMSQFGDGGVVGTKPYCASGAYMDRMSDACSSCRFNPKQATGPEACPMTTLYWDFLDRHRRRFAGNRRMVFQIRNLERKKPAEIESIRRAATTWRANPG